MRKADVFKINLKLDGKMGVGKGRNIDDSSDEKSYSLQESYKNNKN